MTHVLVVYATEHGSTQQVAEAIATAAVARGAYVQTIPFGSVTQPLVGWDLVVLGAPLYSGRWHRDAHRFLKRHRSELASVPVAVFGMGPRRDEKEAWQRSQAPSSTVRWPGTRGWCRRRWRCSAVLTRPGAAGHRDGICGIGLRSAIGPGRCSPSPSTRIE